MICRNSKTNKNTVQNVSESKNEPSAEFREILVAKAKQLFFAFFSEISYLNATLI
jgi:hypothetical protein